MNKKRPIGKPKRSIPKKVDWKGFSGPACVAIGRRLPLGNDGMLRIKFWLRTGAVLRVRMVGITIKADADDFIETARRSSCGS
jgi:hypothetical protein